MWIYGYNVSRRELLHVNIVNTNTVDLRTGDRSQISLSAGLADGSRTSWVKIPIERTKKGRISLISIEARFGSCQVYI
jgi:hypothetical protein